MEAEVVVVDAFIKDGAGGNPAGVVLRADGLDDRAMQAVAREAAFSETAFVLRSARADYRLRFFTPEAEVDLCGHATIAAFSTLALRRGPYAQETRAGVLPVLIEAGGLVFMDQVAPVFSEEAAVAETAAALRTPTSSLARAPRVVSTGLRDLFVELSSAEALAALRPDFVAVSRLSERLDTVGVHAFYVSEEGKAECRNFAPRVGINEESATGTSNGALACLLFSQGRLPSMTLIAAQGASLGRPSEIISRLETQGTRVVRVQAGGRARERRRLMIAYRRASRD